MSALGQKSRISLRSLPLGAYLFAGVLLLRLVGLVRLTDSPFLLPDRGDMHFYNDWALRILHGHLTDHHAFYGLPLYPYLLAGLYKILGYNPFIPAFIQICLEAGTAVLIYRLGVIIFANFEGHETDAASFSRRRGEIIGLGAALGWAVFQPAAAYSIVLMPTAWLVFVFWFVVWQIIKRPEPPRLRGWFGLGVLIGFTAMGIATILFLVPLLLAALLLQRRVPLKHDDPVPAANSFPYRYAAKLLGIALLFLGLGIGASPAWIHNYFLARDPVFLSAHGGINFWIGNNPSATGYPSFPPGLHAGQEAMLQDSITMAEKEAGRTLKRSEVSALWTKKAHNYIRNNLGDWLKLLGEKLANFWNAFQYDDLSIITALREAGVIFPGLRFGLVTAFALPGLVLAWGSFPVSRWLAGAILLHMTSLLSVFVTERYRLAAVPGLLLFAAFCVWQLWHACVAASYHRTITCLALITLSTWFVSIPKREPSLWALDSYNSGLQALESKQLAVAEQKLELAYAYVPQNAELNFALGNLRLTQGDERAAKSYYFATLRLDPRHEGSYNNLGVLASEEKRWHLAAKFFAKALEQNSRDAKTWFLLAKSHLKAGDLEHASAEIGRAIELDASRPEFSALRQELQQH